jgi:DNA-binding LacI/PurR family transcriptional regulator
MTTWARNCWRHANSRAQVPEDVAVIGADNDEIVCGLADPPMSSVAINFERAGYEAAQALDALMHGGKRGRAAFWCAQAMWNRGVRPTLWPSTIYISAAR